MKTAVPRFDKYGCEYTRQDEDVRPSRPLTCEEFEPTKEDIEFVMKKILAAKVKNPKALKKAIRYVICGPENIENKKDKS